MERDDPVTCKVRLEQGVCRRTSVGEAEILPSPHAYLTYEIKPQKVPMCAEHMKLINDGWSMKASLIFRWVPPT